MAVEIDMFGMIRNIGQRQAALCAEVLSLYLLTSFLVSS